MTLSGHSAALAVSAAANYGFAHSFLSYHTYDDRGYNGDQYSAYRYSADIGCQPTEHNYFTLTFLVSLLASLYGLNSINSIPAIIRIETIKPIMFRLPVNAPPI